MANRIPRNAALFHITLLQDTGSNKAGTKAAVYRHVYDGWQMLTESGEKFMVLTSYLRMSEVVQIDDFMLFPEEITEAQFQDVKKITAKHYNRLYNADDIETDNESMIYSSLFDWYLSKHAEAVRKYNAHCFDFLTSDREGAAFMLALYELQNAHTETEITEGKEDTTTTETEPQRATETAQKTADDTTTAGSDTDRTEANQDEEKTIRTGARLYSHPHRHMVTVAGLQEGLVMVVYRGRLYLVSRGDLYTDETETTPAILPAEAAQPAAVIPMENDTTKATQEGTESATATTGRECTQQAAQDAQNAPTTAGTVPGEQDNTGSDTRPPRAKEANQEPGHAAGDHSGQAADHITGPGTAAGDYTGPTTGNTSGPAAEAITGRTTTPPQNPGHACENAPERTERTTAEQVHTTHAKIPPRAAQKDGRNTGRSSQDRRKVTFSVWMYKTGSDPRKILGYPIFDRFSGPNLVRNFQGVYGRYDRGGF